MKLLKLLECAHHVVDSTEGLGVGAKLLLDFEILLEVVVAKLLVHLEEVVEILGCELVRLPDVGDFSSRNVAYGFEVLL